MSPSVLESGCRDEAQTPKALSIMLWNNKQHERPDKDEQRSLQENAEGKKYEEKLLQK